MLWGPRLSEDGYPSAEAASFFADAGIHLHAFDVGVGTEWRGPDPTRLSHYDFSGVEKRFGEVLKADPKARFHLRIHLEIHEREHWWHDLYPRERELDSAGNAATQSFASTLWRDQVIEFLSQYIEHINTIGFGERIFAYQTGAGHTGEWVKGRTSMYHLCGDYSEPMGRYFRSWLEKQYGDVEALRDSWRDGKLRFQDAEVPTAAAQLAARHWIFRDPRTEQPVIDYYHSLADLCGTLVVDFCRTVKEAAGDSSLAGAFYGYLLELAWNAGFFGEGCDSPYSTYQRSGHLGLQKVLDSDYVDFLVSPFSYGFRGIGGHGPGMPPSESVRIHNMVYIYEDDTRTHTAHPLIGFGRGRNLTDSTAILQRNFSEVVVRGHGIWWLAAKGHIDPAEEPALRPLLKSFQDIGTFSLELDRTPCAEIAVLVDDESFFYQGVDNALDVPLVFHQRLWGLPKVGAPADYYLLNDFLDGATRNYKLYIILNPWHLCNRRRKALSNQLRRENKVALWVYAAGYINEKPDLANMAELTGFVFGKGEKTWGMRGHILDFEHEITRELTEDFYWGTDSRLSPIFHLDDKDATVLGQVVYSQGRCLPGLGVKEMGSWRSVYSAVPDIPAPLLRGIVRYAGAHVYSDKGDVLYAGRQLLAVHSAGGGRREFLLPEQVEVVYDLFSGREVASHCRSFAVTLPRSSTTLWYTGDRRLLEKLVV